MKFKITVTPIDNDGNEAGSLVTTFVEQADPNECSKTIAHGPSMQCNTTIPLHSVTFMEHVQFVRNCERAISVYAEYLKTCDE